MISIFLPTILLLIFSAFNLIGLKKELFTTLLQFIVIALSCYLIFRKIGIRFFRQNVTLFYWIFVSVIILTYFIGIEVKGSQRWIDLYFFRFQPSEFFKIFFIIFLANYLSLPKRLADERQIFFKSFFAILPPLYVIYRQPDLATTIVYLVIYISIFSFSNISLKYLLYLLLISILVAPIVWLFMYNYQKERIISFLISFNHHSSASYNMIQAIIASGSGQIIGRGLGMGKQSQLAFLPEYHTDFAFSSLVEQFGFVGGAIVISLYIWLITGFLIQIIKLYSVTGQEVRFQFLCLIGFLSFLVFQIVVNIGMNIGLFPIAGITLPLISYGGSSLTTFFIGLALFIPKSKNELL